MKRMRIPLIIALAVAAIGILFGSIFDFQISSAIASRTNGFGLGVSILAPTLGFCGMSFIGGAFLAFGLQKSRPVWLRVISFIIAVGGYGASVYYSGKEYFGVNGFANAAPSVVGYLIAAVVLALACFLGYWLFRKNESEKGWIFLAIALGVVFLVLVPEITGLKSLFHRPRFRLLADDASLAFKNWWQPTFDYKDYIAAHPGITSEEFKSFPSGHTAEISILLPVIVFLPLAEPKAEKYQLPCFLGAIALCLLTMLSRILAAAHFLSDVSFGFFLMVLTTFIANEVTMRIKALQPVEE